MDRIDAAKHFKRQIWLLLQPKIPYSYEFLRAGHLKPYILVKFQS